MSASSWGCELKYNYQYFHWLWMCVSLLVRLRVEINLKAYQPIPWCVSLLVRLRVEITPINSYLRMIIVSLLVRLRVEIQELKIGHLMMYGQPPREAASWNIFKNGVNVNILLYKKLKIFCTITGAMLQPPESPDRLVYPSNDMTVLLWIWLRNDVTVYLKQH